MHDNDTSFFPSETTHPFRPRDDNSLFARERLRRQLQDDIAAFLQRGGKITEVPPNVTADPPRKPENHYGDRPL